MYAADGSAGAGSAGFASVAEALRAGGASADFLNSSGAAVIRGNLTPDRAAAVRAVLEALGKKAGPEDDLTEGKRFHDALQFA